MDLNISVNNMTDHASSGSTVPIFNCDKGPLAMPAKINIGNKTWDRRGIIQTYDEQVGEYDVWLEEQIIKKDMSVLTALDQIFNMALDTGVVLITHRYPVKHVTHAFMVEKMIKSLAAQAN